MGLNNEKNPVVQLQGSHDPDMADILIFSRTA